MSSTRECWSKIGWFLNLKAYVFDLDGTLVDTEQGGELLERVKSIRRQFALEMGMVIPPMHIRDNLQLKPNQYSIIIKGVEVAGGELMPGYYLAMNPGDVKAEIEREEEKSWDPSKIKWVPAEGAKGRYDRADPQASRDFQNMLKDLKEHGGRLTRDGYFYWVFRNGVTVGRKKQK